MRALLRGGINMFIYNIPKSYEHLVKIAMEKNIKYIIISDDEYIKRFGMSSFESLKDFKF